MEIASASAVGILISRMTIPEKIPYREVASSVVSPAPTIRFTIRAESINCARGMIQALMVIGTAIAISRFDRNFAVASAFPVTVPLFFPRI